MKKFLTILLVAAMTAVSATAIAQDQNPPRQGERPERPERPEGEPGGRHHKGDRPEMTPQQKAHMVTDQMDRLLTLTDKQYKKIYKLNLKEIKEHEADSLFLSRGGMRNGGFGPGPGGPRPGGPGGPGMDQNRPDKPEFKELTDEQMQELRAEHEKARLKKDKKLRKILTDEQYGKWVRAEQERLVKMQQMHKGGRGHGQGHRPDGERGPRPDGGRGPQGHRPDSTGGPGSGQEPQMPQNAPARE